MSMSENKVEGFVIPDVSRRKEITMKQNKEGWIPKEMAYSIVKIKLGFTDCFRQHDSVRKNFVFVEIDSRTS